jgi:hypothetical protein
MTARWICRPCDMLCLGKTHYERHAAGDHSRTPEDERAVWDAEQRAYWAARTDGTIA